MQVFEHLVVGKGLIRSEPRTGPVRLVGRIGGLGLGDQAVRGDATVDYPYNAAALPKPYDP